MFQRFTELFAKDPTHRWAPCRRIPLALYLPYASLNNVAFGDHYQKLSAFGRPSNRLPFKYHQFVYYPLGLVIEGDNEKVEYFEFVTQDYLKKHEPCAVTMIGASGAQIEINQRTSLKEVERVLGAPTRQEQDEYEIVSTYNHGKLDIEFEFSAGAVTRFYVERVNPQ